jgi:hypothetical protein
MSASKLTRRRSLRQKKQAHLRAGGEQGACSRCQAPARLTLKRSLDRGIVSHLLGESRDHFPLQHKRLILTVFKPLI